MNKFFDDVDVFDYDLERKKIISNLDKLKSMSVQEQTLYKKWIECRQYKDRYDSALDTKTRIWKPKNLLNKDLTLFEFKNLKPTLKLAKNVVEQEDWLNLRLFISSFSFDANPGRILKYIIYDEETDLYLGIAGVSSDVVSIKNRDELIGWTREHKFKLGKLNNIAIGSTIVPTQPFGYNFLGGKLSASLLCTKTIRDDWKNIYGDVLVAMTTTSLYGQGSMYNGIPFWKSLGESAGKIFIKPDEEFYDVWHDWIKSNLPEQYEKEITIPSLKNNGPVTGIKQKILSIIMRQLEIKSNDYVHGFKRGIYFSTFYENYKEYLTNKITDTELILKKSIEGDYNTILSWWKPKAENRYLKLFADNKLKSETLFYSKLSFMSWDETKEKYLMDVGR